MGSPGEVSRGRTLSNPLNILVEPMGVEPTASRVRFQIRAQHQQDTPRKLSQIKTYVAERRRLFGYFTSTMALVHGQKADSASVKSCVAPLIAHLILHKTLSTAICELSVSFQGRRKWKSKRSVPGVGMKNVQIVKKTDGQNYEMVVASAGLRR